MKPKIGLALSGGGARGLAHVGVLKVFEQNGISIECISGASMGGVIAAAAACGYSAGAIEEKVLRLASMRELIKLIDISAQRRGLLEGNKVREYLCDFFLDRTFENLKIPLAIPAVDLVDAQEYVFTTGLVLPALLATIAVPGVFQPICIGSHRLVDGGVLNNLPVDHVRALGADVVIAVDVQSDPRKVKPWQDLPEPVHLPLPLPNFFLDFYRAELIMIAEITRARLDAHHPEILLRPTIPEEIDMFLGFPRAREIIAAGEQCAQAALPSILTAIA